MTDQETREVLEAMVELLRTQAIYLRNLQEAFSALYAALKTEHSEIETLVRREMVEIRLFPEHDALIQQAGELLLRLEKSQ